MVKRVLGFVYQEVRGLHQAAYILALFAFGSQLLALVRDRLLAGTFGAGAELDIYYAAFRVPDLLYVLFASTLSVYVLIPFVTRHTEAGDGAHARQLLSQIYSLFLIAYTVIASVLLLAAPYYAGMVFPGITDTGQLTQVMQILLLQPVLLGVSSLYAVVTQLEHRFVLYAISPLLYNLGIIAGIVFFYPVYGLIGLAYGVVLGALLHAGVQWPLVHKSPLRFSLTKQFNWSELKEVLWVSIPRALTLSLNQIVLLVIFAIASILTVGSVSVFQFAFNLQSVPLSVIGVSYSVAAFPTLAALYAGKERERFVSHIMTALRHIIFWSVPVVVLCIVLRAQLVRVILGSGSFNWDDTRLTAAVFALLIIGLVAHAINLLMIRAFYAGGDTRTPLWIGLGSAAVTVVAVMGTLAAYVASPNFALTLTQWLRITDIPGTEVIALALGYTLGMLLQSAWLLLAAQRRFGLPLRRLVRKTFESAVAACMGGGAAYILLQLIVTEVETETFLGILMQGLSAGLVGIVIVVVSYYLLGSRELREIFGSVERKFFSSEVVPQQDEVL